MKKSPTLIDAASQLFHRQGFHATGVEQLCQEAGVSKKTLYRYFPSKEDLIAAALDKRHHDFMAALEQRLEPLAPDSRPAAYLDFIAAWTRQEDFHGCAFINAAAEYSAANALARQAAQAHKQALRARLAGLCRDAGLPAGLSLSLFVLGEGLIVSAQVSGDAAAEIQAARQAWQTLCAGRTAAA